MLELLKKEEVVRRLSEAGLGADLPFLEFARLVAADARMISDEELRLMLAGLRRVEGERKSIADVNKYVVGGEACLHDLVVILGAERGLWDEAGYPKEPVERQPDKDFSRACEDKIHEMWNELKFPLLVFLILDLKSGVRRIDDRAMLELAVMADAGWLFQMPVTNELLEWRLTTLRLAIRAVLFDRGYSEDQVQSSYV